MEGYLAAALIGISLGLIGGGGSILTVPVLVYLFHIDAALAISYSLFIVGSTSLAGSFTYFKKNLVSTKIALIFGVPSIFTIFLARTFLLPLLPAEILSIGSFILTKNILLMILFAILMIFASYSMIKQNPGSRNKKNKQSENYPLIFAEGMGVGIITGIIGAGGGFLIIPALVSLLKLPMKKAIGTSLVIISINSLSGFLFSLGQTSIEWTFLLSITLISIIGILIGSYISTKIKGEKLKPVFGWFILIMGIFIIFKETILH